MTTAKPKQRAGAVRQAAQNLLDAVHSAYPTAFRDFDPHRDVSPERHEQRKELQIRALLERADELKKLLDGYRRSKRKA